MYHKMAQELKDVIEAKNPDLVIQLSPSEGSQENVQMLSNSSAHIALIQNDAKDGASVRSIAAVYPEVLHLLTQTDEEINSLQDLSGKRVGVGGKCSGTYGVVSNLLNFSEVSVGLVDNSNSDDSLLKLKEGKLDAVFILQGLGSPMIRDILTDKKITLSPISVTRNNDDAAEEIARRFSNGFNVHYPFVQPQTIPLMAYSGRMQRPIPAIGVQAVLAVSENLPSDIVKRITQTLFEERAVLAQKEALFSSLDESDAILNLQFPIHKGAENYYHRKDPGFIETYCEVIALMITFVGLVLTGVFWIKEKCLDRQQNRIEEFYIMVQKIMCQIDGEIGKDEIMNLDRELEKINQDAACAVVADQLKADESFLIYQNMLNSCRDMLVRASKSAASA
jgi:hypothetical protein